MAWTSLSERFPEAPPKDPTEQLGPGAYLGHAEYRPEPQYAPFGSSRPRDTASPDRSRDQPRSTSPAPGAYDPQLPKAYDSGLPKRHVPFATGAPRLIDKAAKDSAPGPGAYEVTPKLAEALSCRTMGVPPGERRSMFRSSSAPSIPQTHQSYGYEESGDGRLIRQGPKGNQTFFSGRNGDSVGPGHYDYQAGATAKRATQGSFSCGAPRWQEKEKSTDTPGPGYYDSKQSKQMSIYSSFASQSEQRTKSRMERSQLPGPGQYESRMATRPSLRELHAELQFFGSTSERFKSAASQGPDPGSYQERQQRQRNSGKSSWIKSDRFQGETRSAAMPGPGDYDPTAFDGKGNTVSILGSTGNLAFGSAVSKRFGSLLKDEGPGPGAYDTTQATGGDDGQGRQRRPTKAPSAVFKSETPVDAMTRMAVKEGQQRPPPGSYDPVHARDTGAVLRQPPKGEGFLSAAPRDKFDIASRPAAAPGPGRYDTPLEISAGKRMGTFNRTVVEGAPSGGRPNGLGFDCQSRRFKASSLKNPGPGAYHSDPQWITTTHNIHFGDVG